MLRKVVYPYGYMYSWQKFNYTSLRGKEDFCSNLTMENIIDADYKHARRIWENFEIQNLGEHYDLYM